MRKIVDWVVDYAHMLKGNALMFVHREPPKHYLGHVVKGKTPVIFIPGVLNRWAFCKPLSDYISLLGHPIYIIPSLGINIGDIPSSAKKVREVIDEQKIKKAVIIAHSKGGLIAKYLLAHDNKDHAVLGAVTIATPFSGSAMAKLVPHKSIRELAIDSKIIKYLNSHTAINHKIISIIPEFDNHVWHAKGCVLDGALDNVRVANRGHHKLLFDKSLWSVIVENVDKITGQKTKS